MQTLLLAHGPREVPKANRAAERDTFRQLNRNWTPSSIGCTG
jgi:hypothetical protein